MKYLLTHEQFIKKQKELEAKLSDPKFQAKFDKIINFGKKEIKEPKYYIQITLADIDLITEHQSIRNFDSTTNRYYFHPEDANIPVKAHYHIIPRNSKKELYAVNLDGTAHHRTNKGHIVPKKEAAELRALGVAIPKDNILEELNHDENQLLVESLQSPSYSLFILIDPTSE